MKQINVETATREQLVEFIRRMHPQLQREQERVKELESQITGFQEFIHEKNAEIRELRQQSDRLTEKSASDEETIGALIKQMEAMRLEQAPAANVVTGASASGPGPARGRPVDHVAGKGYAYNDAAGSERSPEAARPGDGQGNGEAGRRPSRTPPPLKETTDTIVAQLRSQNAAAASTISNKTEEIATLESKVRELMEVNAFYSAIVAQHDQEEKARMGQKLVNGGSGQSEDDVAELRQELERLQFQIANLDVQEEKLQRIIRVTEAEKAALRGENEMLKVESVRLEAEMAEMTREYARARRSLAVSASRQSSTVDVRLAYPDDDGPHGRAVSAPQHGSSREAAMRSAGLATTDGYSQQAERRHVSLPGAMASRVSPLSHESRQGVLGGSAAASSSSILSAATSATSRSRFNFRSLRPIRVRNPDAHERDLLDRIHLYEEQLAQMELFEADRQRSFDEMERNRAEMFVAMNGQLEKQRREIHRLRKLHEDASLDSSLTTRPSHNHSVGSALNREEEEERRTTMRRHGSPSPVERCLTAVPTSTQSLPNVESFSGIDEVDGVASASLTERDTTTQRSTQQRRSAQTASSSSMASCALDRLQGEEAHGRFVLWQEAFESAEELFATFHGVTVRDFVEELAACHAKMLGEREALTADLESLQLYNEKLENRLKEMEAELQRSSDDVEKVQAAQASGEDERHARVVDDGVNDELLERKALCTAYLAMEAYTSVVDHYAAMLRLIGNAGTVGDGGTDVADIAEEVARDLAEVQGTLDVLRPHQSGDYQLPKPSAAVEATPSAPVDVAQPLTLPSLFSTAAETAAVKSHSAGKASTSCSRTSSPSPANDAIEANLSEHAMDTLVSDADPALAAAARAAKVGGASSTASETENVQIPDPPRVFGDEDATAATASQLNTNEGSVNRADVRSKEDPRDAVSDDCTTSTEGEAPEEGDGEKLSHISADAADATATSQFADCVEKDDGTGFTSAAPEDAVTAPSVDAVTEAESDEERPGSDALVTQPSNGSARDLQDKTLDTPAPPHVASSASTSIDARENSADRGVAGGDDHGGGDDPVVLHDSDDSDTMSAPSQLEMTAAEEAEFLAQLQNEVAKDNAKLVAGLGEESVAPLMSSDEAASSPASSVSDHEVEGDKAAELSSRHSEASQLDESRDVGVENSTTSSAPIQHGEKRDGLAVALNKISATSSSSASFVDAASLDEVVKTGELSDHAEKRESERSASMESGEARIVHATAQRLSSSPHDFEASASASTSTSATVDAAPESDNVAAEATLSVASGVSATNALPHIVAPDMIPPASLDELFSAHAVVNPPPLPPTNHAPTIAAVPSVPVTPPAPPPPAAPPAFPSSPPGSVPEANKPANSYTTYNYASPPPIPSPTSMFATPPRPVPSRTFFTPSPTHEGNNAQTQRSGLAAKHAESSTSSDDEFEAGFDPFA